MQRHPDQNSTSSKTMSYSFDSLLATFCNSSFNVPIALLTTPLPWVLYIDVHFYVLLNRRAKSCTTLQSNFKSFSPRMNFGGLNNLIISFLTNSMTLTESNYSIDIAQATGHFNICSTATIKYWFPALVRGKGLAKSIQHAWNSPLTGIFPTISFGFARFFFWQMSQLFTKLIFERLVTSVQLELTRGQKTPKLFQCKYYI